MEAMHIRIEDLRQSVRLGWTEEERAHPQIVTMNLRLEIPDEKASISDELSDTVDYTRVIGLIENLCTEISWRLLERMSRDIAGQILTNFRGVESVEISLRKNISTAAQGISVCFTQSRSAFERSR
jgi:dihydroneopterin aldolase